VLTGKVNSSLEAVVRLWIRGPEGEALETEAIIDTGFSGFLSLPQHLVARLGLSFQGRIHGILADGTEGTFQIYEALVLWHGQPHPIIVSAVENEPLLGMAMLRGSELALQVIDGGEVTIHELSVS
jgi:clan AA aspartic protease